MTHEAQAAAEKMIQDMKWRGPNNRKMGHIVLTREQALVILHALNYNVIDDDEAMG